MSRGGAIFRGNTVIIHVCIRVVIWRTGEWLMLITG